MRKSKKLIAILATLAMLVTLLVPMVGPAGATTQNSALTVPNVTTGTGKTLGAMQLKETTPGSIGVGQVATFTLINAKLSGAAWAVAAGDPTGVAGAWVWAPPTVGGNINTITGISIIGQSNNSVIVRVDTIGAGDEGYLRLYVNGFAEVTSTGDVKVNIAAPGTGFSEGDVVVAKAVSAGSTVVAIDTQTVGSGSNKTLGVVRITENTIGSLVVNNGAPTSTNTVKLTLPTGFTWVGVASLATSGFPVAPTVGNFDGRYAYVTINAQSNATTGLIQFAPVVNIDSSEAKKGDINLNVGGTNTGISSNDAVIGSYGDYSVIGGGAGGNPVESTPDVIAGKPDQQIGNLILQETLPGSLLPNRTLKLTLKSNAKWHTVGLAQGEVLAGDGIILVGAGQSFSSDAKSIEFTLGPAQTTSALKFKLKNLTIDLGADVSGDVMLEISGTAGVPTVEVPVAKAIAPVSATAASKPEVKIGLQDQAVGDITIVESKVNTLKKSDVGTQVAEKGNGAVLVYLANTLGAGPGKLILKAPLGVTFASVPTVQVTDGDLQIDLANVKRANNDTEIEMPIKSEGSKVSTIGISNIKVTVDRTVPEGDMTFKLKGNAAIETDCVFTAATTAAKVAGAVCVTPAPGEQKPAGKVVFTINSTTFTVGGVEQAMDVVPYIKDSRTFLPVRYVAQACGVAPENILFSDGKVTLIKGDKVVQLTLGSKVMIINGVAITMDVAAELSSDRTMLPFRWIAQALGAKVSFDENAQTVTMEL